MNKSTASGAVRKTRPPHSDEGSECAEVWKARRNALVAEFMEWLGDTLSQIEHVRAALGSGGALGAALGERAGQVWHHMDTATEVFEDAFKSLRSDVVPLFLLGKGGVK